MGLDPAPELACFRCDFHVHTCLSPCGELDASPAGQVRAALERGLDLMLLCDHNAAGNLAAAQAAARGSRLRVLAGLEVCSAEEAHALALLPGLEQALELERLVWEALPGLNDPELIGMQVLVDEQDRVRGMCERLLIGASTLTLAEVATATHRLGGLLIAAHIDRQAFGVISQLGFVPENIFDALEVSRASDPDFYRDIAGRLGLPIVRGSDAHHPRDVGAVCSTLLISEPSFTEVARALRAEQGRAVLS